MKCYWTVNSSYWPPLRVSQYEVNTSWPPLQKSIVLQYWKPKINSFSYAEKKIMAYVHQLLDQPSQWQTSQQAGPCSVPKFTSTSITVKHLLIKNKNINQSKSSLLIWHYVSYLFLLFLERGPFQICPRRCKWCLIRCSNASIHLKIRPPDNMIIIITFFQEDNMFGTNASLAYGPQKQRHTCVW